MSATHELRQSLTISDGIKRPASRKEVVFKVQEHIKNIFMFIANGGELQANETLNKPQAWENSG
jgi:hypothetical protein